jgi:coproporphyrinogen III oxidase-like Fe-S oxidoreductase
MLIADLFSDLGYAPISGYGFARRIAGTLDAVQHSPKFLYHDLVYGHDGDEIIGYGSSACTRLRGFNLYNFANRREYMAEVMGKRALPHLSFGPVPAPERGVVSFPFRGRLEKSEVAWSDVPPETSRALEESLEADLVVDRGDAYVLTKVGWLFYVNLMYYLMPAVGKRWLSAKIEAQSGAGKHNGDTSLASLRIMMQG